MSPKLGEVVRKFGKNGYFRKKGSVLPFWPVLLVFRITLVSFSDHFELFDHIFGLPLPVFQITWTTLSHCDQNWMRIATLSAGFRR